MYIDRSNTKQPKDTKIFWYIKFYSQFQLLKKYNFSDIFAKYVIIYIVICVFIKCILLYNNSVKLEC